MKTSQLTLFIIQIIFSDNTHTHTRDNNNNNTDDDESTNDADKDEVFGASNTSSSLDNVVLIVGVPKLFSFFFSNNISQCVGLRVHGRHVFRLGRFLGQPMRRVGG